MYSLLLLIQIVFVCTYKDYNYRRISPNADNVANDVTTSVLPQYDVTSPEYDVTVSGDSHQYDVTVLGDSHLDELEPPDSKLNTKLRQQRVPYVLNNTHVQNDIDEERKQITKDHNTSFTLESYHTCYHSYDEIMQYLTLLSTTYPEHCTIENIGCSYEKRELKLIKIGEGNTGVFIDAGIHANEWIGPAAATYVANKLLQELQVQGKAQRLLSKFTWYILPLANPDGYEYSRTVDRHWRKTRSQHQGMAPHVGVDPNRNFDFKWNVGKGSQSTNPQSPVYVGPYANSEPEVQAMTNFMSSKPLHLYLAFHSSGQYLLTSWGYTRKLPRDYKSLEKVGKKAARAIEKVSGNKYKVGPVSRLMYLASGGSLDWAKVEAGIKYSYTVEIGTSHVINATKISSIGEEIYAGVVAAAKAVLRESKMKMATT